MHIERLLRFIAGLVIILSVVGYFYVSPKFIYFILFVGLNLFQSAFTDWCPMIFILEKLGYNRCVKEKKEEK